MKLCWILSTELKYLRFIYVMNCFPMFLSASPKDFVCMKEIRETIPRKKEEAMRKTMHISACYWHFPNLKHYNNK